TSSIYSYTLSLHDALPILCHYIFSTSLSLLDNNSFVLFGVAVKISPNLRFFLACKSLKDFTTSSIQYPRLCSCAPRTSRHKGIRSEEHTSELQSRENLVCR